jgi:glutamate-1-semialdehyde 2,1-aminomutase
MADQTGAVLIFDEVMTSRLSPGGMQRVLNIAPDMTTFGKYLGGGLTFGAFGGCRKIMEQFDPRRPDALVHAGTFNNNVLTMVAGLTGLRDIYTDKMAIDLNQTGDDFRQALQLEIDECGVPMHVSGVGSLLCIHFQREHLKNVKDSNSEPRLRSLLQLSLMLAGIYTANRGYMSLSIALGPQEYIDFRREFRKFLMHHTEVIRAHSPSGTQTLGTVQN